MCGSSLLALASVLVASTVASTPPAFPPGTEARQGLLTAQTGPQTRAWISQEAAREANLLVVTEETAVAAVHRNAAFRNLSRGDTEALAFLVLMEVAKAGQEDVKAIRGQVKQIDDAKTALGRSRTADTAVSVATPRPITINSAGTAPRPRPKEEFNAQLDGARNSFDSMSTMGELESLRLQMAMDRLSKIMSLLSNIMKRMNDTSRGLVQNLK